MIIRYPHNIGDFRAKIIIKEYEFKGTSFSMENLFNIGNFSDVFANMQSLSSAIVLPIPNQLSDDTSINWGTNDIGSMSTTITGAIQDSVNGTSTQGDTAYKSGSIKGNMTILNYQGTNIRSFKLNYVLIPSNKNEAKDISSITHILRHGMLSNRPKQNTVSSNVSKGGVKSISDLFGALSKTVINSANTFSDSPSIFHVNVIGVNDFKFLPSVITDISISSPSDTFQIQTDGYLPATSLQITFSEIVDMTKGTYADLHQGKI